MLRDKEIINEEEFQAKKKKLLDLWNAYYSHLLIILFLLTWIFALIFSERTGRFGGSNIR